MADAASKPPPPLLFQRPSTIAPKTVPPPLPALARQQSIPSLSHHSSLSISQSHSSHHSRHSSASSTLATLEEDHDEDGPGRGARRISAASGEQPASVAVIEEHDEEEEKEWVDGDDEELHVVEEEEGEDEVEARAGQEEKESHFDGPDMDDGDEDEEEDEEGEFDEAEAGEEQDDDSGEQSEPDVLRIRGDSHHSVSASPRSSRASIPQSPVSRAFAIFGREIRHVSPDSSFSSDTLPVPMAQHRVPRTVPPPLPPALSPASPTVAASSPLGRVMAPMVLLSVPPRSPQGLEVPAPLSPLQSPLTPTTPHSPLGFASVNPADVVSPIASVHCSPAFLSQVSPPPPPPMPLPEMGAHSRSASQASNSASNGSSESATPVHGRSAANSVAAAGASKQHEIANKVRASAPAGFQFPTSKLNARAAPAADGQTSGTTAASNPMSASSPLLSQSNAATPPTPNAAGFSPSFTAPSVFTSSSTRNSTTSAPSSPRRIPSSTVSAPPLHSLAGPAQDSEPVVPLLRPATAGEASRPEGRRKAVTAAAPAEAAVVAATDNAPQQAGKHKCSKCVSFSVRGSYCLKHLYHAGLAALAAPNVAPSTLPPLSQTLSAPSQPYTDKMLKIADELLKTEKTYYEALKIAYRSFQLRLEVASQLADNPAELTGLSSGGGGSDKGSGGRRDPLTYLPVLSTVEISTIFSKLNDIFTLSSNLYHDLNTLNCIRVYSHQPHRRESLVSSATDSSSAPAASSSSHLTLLLPFLGSTLLHYSSYFRVYQSYLENYDDAIKTLVALRRERDVLDVWLTWNEKCEGASIDSLLIQPVQRLPRYLLLLQEIIKAEDQRRASQTVDTDSGLFTHYPQGYTDILTAREKISRIADAINSSLHDKETATVVAHLQSLFDTHDTHFVPFATPTRRLIKEGLLKKINETRRNAVFGASSWYHFFLFNDLFLYAEETKKIGGTVRYKLKNTLPLLDLAVVETSGSGSKADKCWALRNEVTGKLLTLSCKSERERTEWCEAILGMQRKLRELTESMHVNTFDGVTSQQKKEKANLNKAKLMMGIGG